MPRIKQGVVEQGFYPRQKKRAGQRLSNEREQAMSKWIVPGKMGLINLRSLKDIN